jgi:hypothetical protein
MLDHIANLLLALLASLAAIVLSVLAWLEAAFGHFLSQLGVPPGAQTVLGIVLAILFLLAAIRLFGGFIRIVLVVVVLAIVVHAVTHHDYAVPGSGKTTHI